LSTREFDRAEPLRRLITLVAGRAESDRRRTDYALLLVLIAALYYAAGKLGIELSVAHGVITPVWAPTGIALAALILFGRRLWPAVALGALIANATSGASVPEAAAISVGNTLEAVVGATLLLRVGFRPALDRVRDVFALILLGAVASTTISATNGVTTLWISGDVPGSSYDSEWLLWWIGDAMGDLVVAPFLLVWAAAPLRKLSRASMLEALALLGLLVGVSSFVFLAGYWRYPHVLFPLLVWAALRFRQPGAVTASFVVAAIAIGGAVNGTTPLGNGSTTEIVQILEGLLAALSVSLLILGAVLEERGAAKGQLERAHDVLTEAQEVAHIGSWEWNIATNRVTWSDELYRLYGLEPRPGEMSYESYLERVHAHDREMIRETVEQAYAAGTPFAFDHRIVLRDGQTRWLHGRGRVIRDETGAPVRMVGTSQDITERKRLDELRDNILSTVSHELRTPLTTIIGSAMTLKKRGSQLAGETYAQIVANLGEQAGRLERLLADLLDVDRLRHGLMHPSFHTTDVGELVTRVVAGHAGDSSRIVVETEPAVAEIDAPKVERIVENLLVNALKHTPPEAEIRVRTENREDGVLIAVDDRGPGVLEQDREAIFEIFKRGESVSQVPGTGIGLSLVTQFAALHGGRAWVEENAGGGASFRVLLPARPPR
jgi:PAS domain S-box-containing protein